MCCGRLMLDKMLNARVGVLMNMEVMNDNVVLRWWNKYNWTTKGRKKKRFEWGKEVLFICKKQYRLNWDLKAKRKTKMGRRKKKFLLVCTFCFSKKKNINKFIYLYLNKSNLVFCTTTQMLDIKFLLRLKSAFSNKSSFQKWKNEKRNLILTFYFCISLMHETIFYILLCMYQKV